MYKSSLLQRGLTLPKSLLRDKRTSKPLADTFEKLRQTLCVSAKALYSQHELINSLQIIEVVLNMGIYLYTFVKQEHCNLFKKADLQPTAAAGLRWTACPGRALAPARLLELCFF